MYLSEDDYKGRMNATLLELATDEDPDVLDYCSQVAQDTISGYAGHIYDIEGELVKESTARNYQVLAWALSIAIYHIYLRLPDVEMPDKVSKDHDKVILDLESLSRGKYTINLPPVPPAEGDDGSADKLRRIGSVTPRTHRI